jgi:ribonuclease P protein component
MVFAIKKRAEFLACAKGRKQHLSCFTLQSLTCSKENPARFGITATKKLGNAAVRNRIKRRLRAVLHEIEPSFGSDHVLIAREPALHTPFLELKMQLQTALKRVTKP